MATRTDSRTADDASLLQLIWLASPALPVGGFSYSEGLEAAIEHGLVKDEATAAPWLIEQLYLSLARGDLAVVAQAVDAWRAADLDRIVSLNEWVLQTRETAELRQQSEQMGRSLGEWIKTVHPELLPGSAPRSPTEAGFPRVPGQAPWWTYPVAFALAATATLATTRNVVLSYAFGWAENMTQAAIKCVPLGQSAGQRMLLRLAKEIPSAVDVALATADEERQAFSPMLAILSARHETQYSRLFRS